MVIGFKVFADSNLRRFLASSNLVKNPLFTCCKIIYAKTGSSDKLLHLCGFIISVNLLPVSNLQRSFILAFLTSITLLRKGFSGFLHSELWDIPLIHLGLWV